MVNFVPVKAVAENTLADITADPKWAWGLEVHEDKILIYWEYLQHYYKEDSHFTIKAEDPEILIALDDWSRLMMRVKIEGNLEQAVEKILRGVVKVAHHYY